MADKNVSKKPRNSSAAQKCGKKPAGHSTLSASSSYRWLDAEKFLMDRTLAGKK